MPSSFAHFVITRFNVHLVGTSNVERPPNPIRVDPQYLEQRFALLETYCLPAIRAQTNQDFHWLILFDADTPALFKARCQSYRRDCPNLTPVYLSSGSRLVPEIVRAMKATSNSTGTHLITTRLDSDDAICSDFVAMVQFQFQGQDNHFVFFKHGYVLKDDKLYRRTYPDNPFVSRISRVHWQAESLASHSENPTVYAGKHGELHKLGSATYIDSALPAWLQVLHRTNLANFLPRNCIRAPIGELRRGFDYLEGIESRAAQEKRLPLLLEQIPARILDTIWKVRLVRRLKRRIFN